MPENPLVNFNTTTNCGYEVNGDYSVIFFEKSSHGLLTFKNAWKIFAELTNLPHNRHTYKKVCYL